VLVRSLRLPEGLLIYCVEPRVYGKSTLNTAHSPKLTNMPSHVLQVSVLDALTRIVLNNLSGLHLGILVGLASNLILGGWASWWALLTLLMWAHLFYQYKATSYIYLFRVSSIVSPGML
jgi:hypothetical protein